MNIVVFGVSAFLVLGLVIACMLICVYAKSTLRSLVAGSVCVAAFVWGVMFLDGREELLSSGWIKRFALLSAMAAAGLICYRKRVRDSREPEDPEDEGSEK